MSTENDPIAWESTHPKRPAANIEEQTPSPAFIVKEQTPAPVLDHVIIKPKFDNLKKESLLKEWREEFTKRMQLESKSRKEMFTFSDACTKIKYHTDKDKVFLKVYSFLKSNPLNNNDYFKYINCYFTTGNKLDEKYFKNNLSKLHGYYKKIDQSKIEGKDYNPFKKDSFDNYVLFMCLKLSGFYSSEMDDNFNVKIEGSREFNPLTNIPSVLRGVLPYEVKEYDIKRAFPSFIDIELGTDFRHNVYEVYDKKHFQILINGNVTNKNADRSKIIKELSKLYGNDADKVCTENRFNNKGQTYKDFSKIEKEYINKFVEVNKLNNYVRLHDGIFVLKNITCNILIFDKVEFSIKECIKPAVENNVLSFYEIDEYNAVTTSPKMYSDFFIQEKFIRISTPDNKIQLLKDTNNVVDFFNHSVDVVSFLKENINEFGSSFDAVANTIAKESTNVILQSFQLIPPTKLKYYSDTKDTFGIPFKNGFFKLQNGQITNESYNSIDGFFAPHKTQKMTFINTNEVGDFETFLKRASTGKKDNFTESDELVFNQFKSMFGYMCHSYKDVKKNPCIVLTDMDADDETRNGGRGKTVVTSGLLHVKKGLIKGGNEFNAAAQFNYNDLDPCHDVYVIDDVPAAFKFDDLYTQILGPISAEKKHLKPLDIPFEDTPKFIITSNWVIPYDEKNVSTNRRFVEFKFSDYYNLNNSPIDEFKKSFFQDWEQDEWNKFYSFAFKCVDLYLKESINSISYDKDNDNYKAYFYNDAVLHECNRIMEVIINSRHYADNFNVTDFLNLYKDSSNHLRHDNYFTKQNTKTLINAWIKKNKQNEVVYNSNRRHWRIIT